jgi:hypothetical protein
MNIRRPTCSPSSRRHFLTSVAIIGAAATASGFVARPARAVPSPGPGRRDISPTERRLRERHEKVLTGLTSTNGWEMERVVDDHGSIYTRPVPGTPLDGLQVRIGDVDVVLVHLVRRFHYEIDELRRGEVVGWCPPAKVRRRRPESALASGTAVRIRPGHCPVGSRGNLHDLEVAVVRDILAELDGVVRWGGDYQVPEESLFYLDVPPGDERLAAVATRIRGWRDEADSGAGTPVDVTSPDRRRAARALELRQRTR